MQSTIKCQSANYHEIDSIITRVGESSKIIFCGDTRQNDLQPSKNRYDVSGLKDFIRVISTLDTFSVINYTTDDIVRSKLIKDYLIAKEKILEDA